MSLAPTRTADILDDLSALADSTRDRLLLLVEANELTVHREPNILRRVFQSRLRQPQVSQDAPGEDEIGAIQALERHVALDTDRLGAVSRFAPASFCTDIYQSPGECP